MRSTMFVVLITIASQGVHANERGCAIHARKTHDCTDCAAAPPGGSHRCNCDHCRRVTNDPKDCVADRGRMRAERPPMTPAFPAAPGVFAAPPASGTVSGESTAIGINGPALHFPAMSLRMPSLQLPSLTRYRSGARMRLDAADAPFVSAGQASVVAAAPVTAVAAPVLAPQAMTLPTAPPAAPATPQAPPCKPAEQAASITPDELQQAIEMIRRARQPSSEPLNSGSPNCSSKNDQSGLNRRLQSLEAREQELIGQLHVLEEALQRLTVPASTDGDQTSIDQPSSQRMRGAPRRLPEPIASTGQNLPDDAVHHVMPANYGAIYQTQYLTTPKINQQSPPASRQPKIERLPPP